MTDRDLPVQKQRTNEVKEQHLTSSLKARPTKGFEASLVGSISIFDVVLESLTETDIKAQHLFEIL